MGAVLNYIVVALPVMFGGKTLTVPEISANAFYCLQLVSAFSMLVNVSKDISDLLGYTARIEHFLSLLKTMDLQKRTPRPIVPSTPNMDPTCDDPESANIVEVPSSSSALSPSKNYGGVMMVGDHIAFDNVSVYTPDGQILVSGISFFFFFFLFFFFFFSYDSYFVEKNFFLNKKNRYFVRGFFRKKCSYHGYFGLW